MIKIGVTQRQIILNDYDVYDAIETKLFEYFQRIGLHLVPIPNYFGQLGKNVEFKDWLKENNVKNFLFSGGGDPLILDARYNLEQQILDFSKLELLPIFGICRGLERMVINEGGTLKIANGHINSKTLLSGEIQGQFNCFHNLKIDKLPKNFRVTSISHDKTIEAIAHVLYPWEACMWHPERTFETNLGFENRLLDFFKTHD